MNDFQRAQAASMGASLDMSVDTGLRSFMLGIYNKMALGLVLSGILAFATSSIAPVRDLFFVVDGAGNLAGITPAGWALKFAPLVALLIGMFAMRNPSKTGASLYYWLIVSLIGAGLGMLALVYTGESLAKTFFITAAAFGGLSLYGYTTKKNLSGFGTFLIMGLIGLIVASLVNMFLQSSALGFAISVIGVLIFSGLIAFDTQRLKFEYSYIAGDGTAMSVATSFGALSLYLNFINLFQFLLAFLGERE
jgi:hypothetical protein